MKKWWIAISFALGLLLGGVGLMHLQQSAAGKQRISLRQIGTQRIVQFENDDVKVWKSIVVPNAPLTMHRHEHGRVIIALKGGTMKIVEQSGASEPHMWETGKAYWLPPKCSRYDACRRERRRSADRSHGG